MSLNRLFKFTPDILSTVNRVIVGGDIHGDYESFQRIRRIFDFENDYLILLGDYGDRGPKGIEVIRGVNELVRKFPETVIALKGNHEDYTWDGRPKFMPCDLISEASRKKGGWDTYFKDELRSFVNELYLAALVPDEVLFVHGGISNRISSVDDLQYPTQYIEEDILWSDPFGGDGEYQNVRGVGVMFGEDVCEEVCRRLRIKRIVRSHQPRKATDGPYVEHDGRIITISSTIMYGGNPFILALPADALSAAFQHLERYIVSLR